MKNIATGLRHLFPTASFGPFGDINVTEINGIEKIETWKLPVAIPDDATINQATTAAMADRVGKQSQDNSRKAQAQSLLNKIESGQNLTNAEQQDFNKFVLRKLLQ